MLEQIEITHYRSCENTEFAVPPKLGVLIGPNGSGKTNTLRAIQLLQQLCHDSTLRHTREEEDEFDTECTIKARFNLQGKRATLTAQISLDTDESNQDRVVQAEQTWYLPDFSGNRKRVVMPLHLLLLLLRKNHSKHHSTVQLMFDYDYDVPKEVLEALWNVRRFLLEMKYYSASQFTNPSVCPVSFPLEKQGTYRRGIRVRGHAKFLFDLHEAYSLYRNRYDEFLDLVGPDGIGLVDKIHFQEIKTSSIDYRVRAGGKIRKKNKETILIIPQFSIGSNTLSPNQLSEGTFKSLTLLFYLITDQSPLLMIEEPEVCVHHGLLSSIVELIKTYSDFKQILITTHSDFVLDSISPENLLKVSRHPKKGTLVQRISKALSKKDLSALKQYLKTEGNLGEYWKIGGLD